MLGLEDNVAIARGVALTLTLDLGGHVSGNFLPRFARLFGAFLSRLELLFSSGVGLLVLFDLSRVLSKQLIELLASSGARGLLSFLLLSGLLLKLRIVLLLPVPIEFMRKIENKMWLIVSFVSQSGALKV